MLNVLTSIEKASFAKDFSWMFTERGIVLKDWIRNSLVLNRA